MFNRPIFNIHFKVLLKIMTGKFFDLTKNGTNHHRIFVGLKRDRKAILAVASRSFHPIYFDVDG